LIEEKLASFTQLQPEFEQCFQFVQEVHGQKRFTHVTIREIVAYLHALWICECKDCLLSVHRTMGRYEGLTCLKLLQDWQTGETSEVIAFLQRKLDGLPFAMLTSQIQEISQTSPVQEGLLERLTHGREILLNRLMNMGEALSAIFTLSAEDLLHQVRAACASAGHEPQQITQQIAEMQRPLYAFVPHQRLAQRNILVMNKVGTNGIAASQDHPGKRTEKVLAAHENSSALAEHLVSGYREMLSPWSNNLLLHTFVDRQEQGEGMRI